MRKIFFLLILSAFFCVQHVSAQRDTVMAYMKTYNSAPWLKEYEAIVDTKDSADFIRIITTPDSSIDVKLFQVKDFYLNGNPKLNATSITGAVEPQFHGPCIAYFPNGKRKRICNYDKGRPTGEFYEYYPNGKPYLSGYYKKDTLLIQNSSDSTGKVWVENGKGIFYRYDDNFTHVIGMGALLNGLKDGEWQGDLTDSVSYIATFKEGKVITGTTTFKSGIKYSFKDEFTVPEFKGGLQNFAHYLGKAIIYPAAARQHDIQGRAIVEFVVDKTGVLHHVHAISGHELLAQEAVRVMQLSPQWDPATSYGIPVEVPYTVPISFTLAVENN